MGIENLIIYLKPALIIAGILFFYFIILKRIKNRLLKHFKSKVMIHNITVSLNIFTYIFIGILIVLIFFYFTGNILTMGLTAGLLTAALGWALQRPITGIAAWIMVITKSPFKIGDRILIGGMKGDVLDITLTHIYLKEVGGTIDSEETSGRTVMIPNSIIFEQNIINYTVQDEFILDDVGVLVTYESNLDKAIRICESIAKRVMKNSLAKMPMPPYVRVYFNNSGIDVKTRYYVNVAERVKISSEITREIFREFKKEKDLEIAYPHTEVIFRKKSEK